MTKKISLYVALAVIALNVSCKKTEEASQTTTEGTEQTAPTDATTANSNNAVNATTGAAPHKPMQIQSIDGKFPVMTFATEEHDFGNIDEGDKVAYDFTFKNTGEANLIIMDAKGSCGCTVPEYPKDPIAPGEKGKIHVVFNSKGKVGQQTKTVTLTCNTKEGNKVLTIKSKIFSLH